MKPLRSVPSLSIYEAFVLFFVFWFGSYVYHYLFTTKGIKPLYGYFLLVGLVAITQSSRSRMGLGIAGTADVYFRAFLAWLGADLLYATLTFLQAFQDSVTIQHFILQFEAIVLMASFAILLATPRGVRLASGGFACLAIFSALMSVFDFVHPTFSTVGGRGAGFYANANLAGYAILATMTAGLNSVPRQFRIGFIAICGIGVLCTFSRAGFLLWGATIIWMGWQGAFGQPRLRLVLGGVSLLVAALAAFLLFTGALGAVIKSTPLQNYLTPNTQARLGIGASVLSGNAANQREALVSDSLESAARAPWFGHGLGYTRNWSYGPPPHNMYLLFLVEGGVIGLAFYILLLVILWRASTGIGRVLVVQLILDGAFRHTQLISPPILLMISFVVAHGVAVKSHRAGRPRSLRSAAA